MNNPKREIIVITISDSEDSDHEDIDITTLPRPASASSCSDSGFSSKISSGSNSPTVLQSPPPPSLNSDLASFTVDEPEDAQCMETDCNSTSAIQDSKYDSFLHFCMNKSEGCQEKLLLKDMQSHLQVCSFKPIYHCFLDQNKESCSWKRKGSSRPRGLLVLAEHFQKDHHVSIVPVSDIDFAATVTLPCYSADTGIQQAPLIPSFVATHIFGYKGTKLILAIRHLEDHVVVWLWDLEGQWVNKRNLQLLCRLSTPKGAISAPEWHTKQVVHNIMSEPKLEPRNVEFDMAGQVVLPTKASKGVVAFNYRDIYDCGVVPWVKSTDVDQFQVKLDLF